jgi:hypothetical protein
LVQRLQRSKHYYNKVIYRQQQQKSLKGFNKTQLELETTEISFTRQMEFPITINLLLLLKAENSSENRQ